LRKSGVGAHVIALGDVSVAGRKIIVTYTLYAFFKADGSRANPPFAGVVPPVSGQEACVFHVPGRSALRHDAGRRLAAGLNPRSV